MRGIGTLGTWHCRRLGAFLFAAAGALQLIGGPPALAQASPSAFTSATRYDAMHRVTGTIAPDPDGAGALKYAAVRNTYDGAGRLVKVEKGELSAWQSESVAPPAWTGFSVLQTLDTLYDSQSRKVRESLSGGGSVQTVTQYSYDADGNLECTAIRMNPAVYGSLPASACTHSTQGASGPDRITRNLYDAAGQLLQVREGVGTPIEAAEATWSYTPSGRKEHVIDGEGNRATFVYDGHDRLSQWLFPSTARPGGYDGSSPASALASAGSVNAADYEQYDYDANGNRTSLRKRSGQTISYSYDALDRVTSKSATDITSYTYDAEGHQLTAMFSSGEGITNVYDGFGQLTSASSTMGGTSRNLTYLYDANGNRTRITHPDSSFFTYVYDGMDRLSGILEGAGTNLVTIAYDQLGRRSSLARTGAGTTAYAYDNASRLQSLTQDLNGTTGDQSLTFGYNPASQISSKTASNDTYAWTAFVALSRPYTTNGLNQYTAAGPASFTYDTKGNLTSDGTSTFAYDMENRLTSATAAGQTATLTYDPTGRLSQVVKGSADTRLVYDGDDLVAEYNGSGTLLRRYVHGPGEDEPLAQYEGANLLTRRFLHADQQGSVIAITDVSGASMTTNRYDEYGIPASTNGGRFQYTGQQWLSEVGLYHYKARFYSPSLGRFLQTDPIGYDDQINLYAYVANDPVNHTDPDGQQSEEVMDRRNQAFLTALEECDGGCLQMYAEAASIPLSFYGVTGFARGAILGAGAFSLARREGLAAASGLLRTAATRRGNFGLGMATERTSEKLGQAFVGKGATVSRSGQALVSKDGKRVFRFATGKRDGSRQANFVTREAVMKDGKFVKWQEVGNGHLTVRSARTQPPTGTRIRRVDED